MGDVNNTACIEFQERSARALVDRAPIHVPFVYRCGRPNCGTLWRCAERFPELRNMCPWCFDIPDHVLGKSKPKLSVFTSVITEEKFAELGNKAYVDWGLYNS